jgi:Tfp pilus assembly protein PilO
MEKFVEYSPIIIVVLMFFVQQKIFVTPEQLEKKHREIIEEMEEKFVSIISFKDLKDQFSEVKEKIDKMYDLLIDLK